MTRPFHGKHMNSLCDDGDHSESSRDSTPAGWKWVPLVTACPDIFDCAHRTPKYSASGSFPALRPRDVVNGVLRLDSAARVDAVEFEKQTKRQAPRPADIVYSRELSYGWAASVPEGIRVCLSQGMVLLQPPAVVLDTDYFRTLLNGPTVRSQAAARVVGSAHPHLNLSDIKSFRIPIPPLPEQRRIVAKIEALTARSRRAKAALEAIPPLIERFKQSVLGAAFRGDLTADWRKKHPDVEPASELLRRIRIERRQKWEAAELAKLTAAGKAPRNERWKEKYKEPEPVDTGGVAGVAGGLGVGCA